MQAGRLRTAFHASPQTSRYHQVEYLLLDAEIQASGQVVFLYVSKQLLLMLGTGLSAFIIGKGLFRGPLRLTALEEAALLTPVGLGVLILLLFALGVLGFLSLTSVLGGIGLLLLWSLWRLKVWAWLGGLRTLRLRINLGKVLFLAAVLALLTPIALAPLTPPHYSDEVRYHLPYALHFVEQGAIAPDLHLRYPFFTLNINLLYSFALMVGDEVTTHYMHFMLGLLTALNLYVLARRLGNAAIAFGSVLLFLTLPLVVQLASSAYIDLGLACFVFAAIVCLSRCRNQEGLPFALCSGFLFGIALGSKYLALAYIPIMLGWAYFHAKSWRPTLLFISVALVVGLPWYLYNAIHTGNPFSPFAGQVFGYWPWRPEDTAAQIRQLGKLGFGGQPVALLMLPYNLVVNHWSFSSPALPLVLVAAFPLFLYIPWINRETRPFAVLLLMAMIVWIFSAQEIRYLAAFLPLWCFLSMWFFVRLIVLLGKWVLPQGTSIFSTKRLHHAASFLCIPLALLNYSDNWRLVFPSEAKELVLNRETFLEKRLAEYGLIDYLRNSDIEGKIIYQIDTGALLTYVRNNRVIGDFFGILGREYLLDKYRRNAEGVIGELSENNVSFLAVNRRSLNSAWHQYIRDYLPIEYEDENVVLFALPNAE